jgi:Ca-activated chloride channel family protein
MAVVLFAGPLLQEPTIRVSVDLVTIGVRVTDGKGRDITGLRREDFEVYEEGVRQEIASFSGEEQPITLGILLDHSSSMAENSKLERAKDAAFSLVRASRAGSEFFFVPFDDKVSVTADFTREHDRVEAALRAVTLGGGTSLYDAILEGLARSSRAGYPRQVLVVISDGADQHSAHRFEDVIATIRESRVQLYGIGYFSKTEEEMFHDGGATLYALDGTAVDNPRHVLQRLAKESGAQSFFPRSDGDLRGAVERITMDVRSQYTLGYYPSSPPRAGEYRRIAVKVRGKSYVVRARPGYGTRTVSPAAPRPVTEASAFRTKVERRGGLVTYHDDFEDAQSGWPRQPGRSDYRKGAYEMSGGNVTALNGPRFRDFRARVGLDVRPPARSGRLPAQSSAAGMILRQGTEGCYAVLYVPAAGASRAQVELIKRDRHGVTELQRWPDPPRRAGRSLLEAVLRGSRIEVRMNGVLLGSKDDASFAEGRVGLVLAGPAGGGVVFDDLVVEEIP